MSAELSPLLSSVSWLIWGLFVAHFLLEFVVAPRKTVYIRRHWMTALSLVLPALRAFRVLRVLRLVRLAPTSRSIGLLRLVTSLNRGMTAVSRLLQQHAVGYVIAITALVLFAGAAGMYRFERPTSHGEASIDQVVSSGQGLETYGDALWWTGMILRTMASEYWPKTPQGRILCWLLAVYAFSIFGYITATIASFLIGQEKTRDREKARLQLQFRAVGQELAAMRVEIQSLRRLLEERK